MLHSCAGLPKCLYRVSVVHHLSPEMVNLTATDPGGTPTKRCLGSLGGEREGFDCVDVTGSHHRVKESKLLPAQYMGINNINYGGSNSSSNTIYIPCPSLKKLDCEPLPSLPNPVFTSLILWTALFPAASCLQDNSKHTERGEGKQDQRDRGEQSAYHEYKYGSMFTHCPLSLQ